jgi:hypothetical protein
MTMLRVAAGKLLLPALLLVGSALLVKTAVDAWSTWRQTETLVARMQLEKANATAGRMAQYLDRKSRRQAPGDQNRVSSSSYSNWLSRAVRAATRRGPLSCSRPT